MLTYFKKGFAIGLSQWKITSIVYFFQLCIALTLGLQVMKVMDASIGNSLEINKLVQNYDHTVIRDFLKMHGGSVSPLIGQLRWLIIIYLFFAVFIDAGLLFCARKETKATGQDFFQGGAKYFFSFSKIALFFFAIAASWTGFVFIPTITFLLPALENLPNEKYVVWFFFAIIIVYLLGLSAIFLWSVSSRIWRLVNEATIWQAIKNGWLGFRKNKKRLWPLLGIFFLMQVLMTATYWWLDSILGMKSALLIFIMVLIQQFYIFIRIMIRQMMYGSW
jgi:hypothetical protein